MIDKLAKNNIIHANKAANLKSGLAQARCFFKVIEDNLKKRPFIVEGLFFCMLLIK